MYSPEFVRPLKSVHTYFVEVLLNRFELRRHGRGAKLIVDFDDETPTLTSRYGTSHVRKNIPDFDANARKHRKAIDTFFRGKSSKFVFNDPLFPFRYASGGVLPVVRLEDRDYYVLFYRECFPIGWNLANGGTDGWHELLNPNITVERELREELLIFDRPAQQRYVLDMESENPEDMPEYITARRLWAEKLLKAGWPPIGSFRQVLTPLKWIDGPDRLEVRVKGERQSEIAGCYLNINPEDFGIEIDRIAKLTVDDTVTLCDGELLDHERLVDAVVGLFDVDRANEAILKGKTEFIPDRFFLDGKSYGSMDRRRFERIVSKDFVGRIERDLKRKWDRREWDDAAVKFNLCPATRGIAVKAAGLSQEARRFEAKAATKAVASAKQTGWPRSRAEAKRRGQPEPTRRVITTVGSKTALASAPARRDWRAKRAGKPYDVFITFGTEDLAFARRVKDRIEKETGLSVFFSSELDHAAFGEVIEKALASANCLVAIGTAPQNLGKRWPQFECRLFHILMLNERKPETAQLMSYISGFKPIDLPLPLPYYNAHVHDEKRPQVSVENLIRDIKKSFPPRSRRR
jgi:hypothetical protein